jgi:hypothetical protein
MIYLADAGFDAFAVDLAAAGFRRVASVWHVRGAVTELDLDVIATRGCGQELGFLNLLMSWLAALDDFRNWLIREAA